MANIVGIATNQIVEGILDGAPVAEQATIARRGTRGLTDVEKMAISVQKNKIFNPSMLKKK